MRRLYRYALTIGLAGGLILGAAHGEIAATASPSLRSALVLVASSTTPRIPWHDRLQRVRFQSLEHGYWTRREVQLSARAAAVRYHVDVARMLCTAERESGFYWRAYNFSSGASGVMQHLQRYWPGRRGAYRSAATPALQIKAGIGAFNARANVLVAARMIHLNGWGAWAGGCV